MHSFRSFRSFVLVLVGGRAYFRARLTHGLDSQTQTGYLSFSARSFQSSSWWMASHFAFLICIRRCICLAVHVPLAGLNFQCGIWGTPSPSAPHPLVRCSWFTPR
ncbi:hypothetical protein B0H14DRAFT_2669937 [Mycena olivaceomarginata]|nr:hypothetical protein B0H14DRAFT_2669937 [Mycena olivaceomarginata]